MSGRDPRRGQTAQDQQREKKEPEKQSHTLIITYKCYRFNALTEVLEWGTFSTSKPLFENASNKVIFAFFIHQREGRGGVPGKSAAMFTTINPQVLGKPKGYSNGMLAPSGGRILFVAGQIGWDGDGKFVGPGFLEQFRKALENALKVVKEAGGMPEHVGRMTLYVVDKQEYSACQREVGACYRELMGKHFPAMALVEVKSLLEAQARVEIEITAVL